MKQLEIYCEAPAWSDEDVIVDEAWTGGDCTAMGDSVSFIVSVPAEWSQCKSMF